MRSSWNGALKVGLLVFPVKLYRVTEDNEYELHQIHKKDSARVQYRRFCTLDGEEVPYDELGKGKEVGDLMLPMTDEDMAKLSAFAGRVVDVSEFIQLAEVDFTAFGDAYYIEPDGPATVHVYTLLRQQIKASGRVGVATFSMRSKDSLAVIHARGKMLILQRMAWPSEVREPAFKFLAEEVVITDMERDLARQLVDTMSGPWQPEKHRSRYGEAFTALIQAKLEGTPPPEPPPAAKQEAIKDIGAVLTAAIQAEKEKKEAS